MADGILLLRPKGKKTDSRVFGMEQLGLGYVAAEVRRQGLRANILDGFLEPDKYDLFLRTDEGEKYSLIGFPIYPESVLQVARDVATIRRNGVSTHVTVGNHLATLNDVEVLKDFSQFDSAIRGEGEHTTVELIEAIIGGQDFGSIRGLTYRTGTTIQHNPARANIQDLDSLPFPARDTLPLVLGLGNIPLIYSSRGCNARCDFCSVHNFFNASPNGSWRARSPTNVVDEMEALAARFNVNEFAFADEQFMGHGKAGKARALEISRELLRRKLKYRWYIETRAADVQKDVFSQLAEAGLAVVFMGLESGYDGALRELNKGTRVDTLLDAIETLKSLNIIPSGGFIMFRPTSTLQELSANLDFLERVGCVEPTSLVTRLRVYSGTALENDLRQRRVLLGKYSRYSWQFDDAGVERCYGILQESAGTISLCYNEFARFRREGIVTYEECLALHRALNAPFIRIARTIVDAFRNRCPDALEVQRRAREEFVEAAQQFLRLIRFVEAISQQRQLTDGVRLLSPMSLC